VSFVHGEHASLVAAREAEAGRPRKSRADSDVMAHPTVLAFNLSLAGDAAELQKMLASGSVAPSAAREEGMYKAWTLLHAAASKGHGAVVDVLLAAGADSSAKNAKGQTPEEQATAKGHDAIATKLQKAGNSAPAAAAPAAPAAPALTIPPAAAATPAAAAPPAAALATPAPAPPTKADFSLPAALGAMQLRDEDGGGAAPLLPATNGLDADALEDAFDQMIDRLPEIEGDRLTDAIAALDGQPRLDAMRRALAQHTKTNAASGAPDSLANAAPPPAAPPPAAPPPAPPPAVPPAAAPPAAAPPPPQPTAQSTVQPMGRGQGGGKGALGRGGKGAGGRGGGTAAALTASDAPPSAVGTLMAMCSEAEAREREMCLELSALEQQAPGSASAPPPPQPSAGRLDMKRSHDRPRVDFAKAVKRYQRPAAGAPPPAPSELRPLPVLISTVDYLLSLWCDRADVAPLVRYVFISDRLRAVQQDLTVQRLVSPALLARIVRFHLLIELEFVSLPNAINAGFSAVQNRSLLCNALISALEADTDADASSDVSISAVSTSAAGIATPALPVALHAELLSYFVLLHADEPPTMLPELARSPAAVVGDPAVRRALRVAGSLVRDDVTGWRRAVDTCTLLEVGCVMRLLPAVRASSLQQCNAAYNKMEAVPLTGLCARLIMVDAADAERCAAGHGIKHDTFAEDKPGTVRFRAAGFTATPPAKPPEPPFAPPSIRVVQQWLRRQQQANAPSADQPVPAIAPLSEEAALLRKAKRRPPPKGLLTDEEEAAAAADAESTAREATRAPAAAAPASGLAGKVVGLSVRDLTLRMLNLGESPGF